MPPAATLAPTLALALLSVAQEHARVALPCLPNPDNCHSGRIRPVKISQHTLKLTQFTDERGADKYLVVHLTTASDGRQLPRSVRGTTMANRSYLFACNEVPGNDDFVAIGLSEHEWDIPLVHKLMVGTNPRIVRSAIWDHNIAILANRDQAVERATAVLDRIGEVQLEDRRSFMRELQAMRSYLASVPQTRYILLEAGEILAMMDIELEEAVAELLDEVNSLERLARRLIAGKEKASLANLRGDWKEKCRPGIWSSVLFFDLTGQTPQEVTGSANQEAKGNDNNAASMTIAEQVEFYGIQKSILDARRNDDAPFVATLNAFRDRDGREFTLATLNAELPTWLPQCDIVALVRANPIAQTAELLGYVDFGTLLKVLGEKAAPVGLIPERWGVDIALLPSELRALGARQDP